MPIAYFHKSHLHRRLSKQKRTNASQKKNQAQNTHAPADDKKCGRLTKCAGVCVCVCQQKRR